MLLVMNTLRVASSAALAACIICVAPTGVATAPFEADVRTGPERSRAGPDIDQVDRAGDEHGARVTLGPGGRDIRLAGDLTEGVAARVQALLDAHPEVERIHLTSDGGLVDEAVALGASIAARGLDTYVPDACASACTLAFVHGRRRYLLAEAGLGFHAPYEDEGDGAVSAVDAAPERAAYLAAGIAPAFVTRALSVAPDDIWIPEVAQLRAAGVVTEIVGSDRFPDSTLDADPSPTAARAVVLRNLPILSRVDGDTVDALAAWYRDGYGAGRSEGHAFEGLRRRASDRLRRRFLSADDGTVRTLGQTLLAAMRVAGDGACRIIAAGDLVAADEALRSSAGPAPEGLGPLVARTMRPDGPAFERSARAETIRARSASPEGCAPLIEEARRALERPPREAAAAVRTLFLRGLPSEVARLDGP